ncbi:MULTISPECIES: N-acetyltransferase [Listeria]|uniref:GNAT family N-acetyltransferase n=1 Tax=Listeria TaxID=1637 RepID=UPI000B58FDF8|nr:MULTISPECIES: GNAT family N-acetyltransferase [Listeria]
MKRNYHVKFLNEKDIALAEHVCAKCEDYFQIEQGRKANSSDAHAILTDLPDGKTKFDKFVMAILDDQEEPIGLIDVVADFPKKGEWIIGLLLLVPDAREAGLGRVLHQVIRDWATDGGAKSLRIGVLNENEAAKGFWEHLGYQKQEEKTTQFGEKTHVVSVYTLQI